MPIAITDQPLEDALTALAARQDVPTNKRAMTWAILRAAVEAVRRSGDPRAWKTETSDHDPDTAPP